MITVQTSQNPFAVARVAAASADVIAGTTRVPKVVSAIEPETKYFISKDERSKGALYFYNNRMAAGRRAVWVWASMVTLALFPKFPQRAINNKLYRSCECLD